MCTQIPAGPSVVHICTRGPHPSTWNTCACEPAAFHSLAFTPCGAKGNRRNWRWQWAQRFSWKRKVQKWDVCEAHVIFSCRSDTDTKLKQTCFQLYKHQLLFIAYCIWVFCPIKATTSFQKEHKECAKHSTRTWLLGRYLTCTFSFLFWRRLCSSLGSWEAIFSVVDPWWRYKALLTAIEGGGSQNSVGCGYWMQDLTHFFSSSLERTKRVKFLSSMKPINKAMAPPTAEAMMMVSVLSTNLTAASTKEKRRKKERMKKQRIPAPVWP